MEQLPNLPDEELARRYSTGRKPEYIRILLKRYEAYINKIIKSVLKAHGIFEDRVWDIRDDIFQEVCVEVLVDETLGDTGEFKPWIRKVTRRVAKREVRRILRRNGIRLNSNTDPMSLISQIPAQNQGPARQLISDQLLDAINEFMKILPKKHRKIFSMYYFDGYEAGEIAERLGTTEGTIRVTIYRLIERFKKSLKRKGLC